MGIGDGLITDILNTDIYSDVYIVSDEEALSMSKHLALHRRNNCAGYQADPTWRAAVQMPKEAGKRKRVITILPDTV
jgi:cysteine synthase A